MSLVDGYKMYLHCLKLEKFRRYEQLEVEFNSGLNLLVGENDSGKTAIVDAIKYVLNTQSYEYLRPRIEDFYLDQAKTNPIAPQNSALDALSRAFDKHEAKTLLIGLVLIKTKITS
uniref:Chromosome partition protein Smc n=1 Tax=Aliivibrio wodanis TaxID=80852 RepID=A0A5Q4ZVF5_9GAMM|nr:Chromosome partition protein Smc [Aliivibrio wodanis]